MRKPNNSTGIFAIMLLTLCIIMMQTAFSQTDCDPPCEQPIDSSEPDVSGNRSNPCSNIISLGVGGPANLQYFVQNGTGEWPTSFCYTQVCNGKEQIYSFTAPHTGIYKIEITYTNFQLVAYHWKSGPCSSSGWDCISLPHNPGTYGNMNWTAGNTYYILLDARDALLANHQFYLNVPEAPGTWYGTFNSNWHLSNNWSGGIVPDETVDVIIPSGTNFQPNVQNNNAKCKSLTVQANATLNIGAYELHAHGAVNIHGALNMTSTLSKLRTESDINWHPGSSASLTASSTIFVRGNWEFMNGANIQLNTGFVDFFGSGNSYMRTRDAGSHFYHVRNNKAGTLLGHSGASTQPCRINGNLYIYTNCKLISNISQNIQLGGFVSNMSGMIELSNGTFVFGGAGSISYFMPGDYFNHVTVNSTGTTTFDNNIEIRGNLLIQSGVLSVGNKTITLKGNWTNNAFPTGFDAGTGRVIFNGSGHQYVYSNENFNILEANMGAALRIDNASRVVTCNQYHWTAGGIDVIAGTFTAGDLAQNGIYGGFWLGTSNATINLINSTGSTWVDLRGQIYNYGGTLNLSGTIADWPYANGAHLEMTGGVIDFKTCGLTIYNSYAWTHNITGGTIRLSRWYSGNRADFTPTAGTFEFYGSTDFNITQSNGSTLHHVKINKGARDGDEDQINGPVYDERSNELLSDGSRANTISLASNISITGNLDIDAGTFSIGQYTCDIGGNTNITGTLAMTHASGLINAYGNVTWKTGSTANFTAMSVFNVWGHWNFQSGSNANLANGVVAFAGSSNKYVTNHSLESSFNNISSYKTTGFKVGIEHSSSSPLTINGNIYVHPNAGFGIYSLFNVILKGDVNSDGDFHCNFGTVVLNGVDQNLRMNTGNYFRNLKFNQNGTVTIDNSLSNILDVKRNVVIQSGVFNMQDRIMHVGGNWTNDVGTAAFNEGTGRVIFNGTGDQTCNSETFNILEVNKASGTLNFPGTTVCASYDWTAGGIIVNGGTFTATDLADNGLFGSYTVSNGTINLHQDDGQYVDFAGDITIGNGGVLNVYGGSMMSYWPFFSDASLTMTGNAILDIKDQGILVSNNAHSFTTNITGGTIRTSGGFQGNRADFTPTAGTFEFYGSGNRNISQSNGSKLHHVLINKSAKDGGEDTGSVPVYDKRSGALLSDGGKTNTINLGSNFSLTGSLNITSGSLDVGPYQLDVADDINIHDHLIMTNSAAVVNVGDEIIWHPGSTDMINNGNIYCYIWTFEEGTLAMLEPGNTVHVSGGIYNYDLDAEFGHLIWEDWNTTRNNKVRSKSAALQERIVENETGIANNENPIKEPLENGKTSYPRKVSGNCSWLGSGWLHWEDIIVQGTADITSGCSVELGNMISLTTFSDFTLNGALKLAGGNCYVDGLFHIAGTGELIIQGGEFIVENGSTSYNNLYGTLTMTDGLFQTDINLRIQSTASTNISGGMIRARVFLAESAGTFEPAGGTVEIQTFNNGYGTVKCSNGNFFNNLNVNEAGNGGGAKLMTDIMIVNDLNIYKGNLWFFGFAASVNGNVNIFEGGLYMKDPNDVLNAGNDPADEILWTSDATFEWNEMGRINIFGNCTIENGVSHNVKADQTFAFVGTLNQVFNNLDDATFGTIELAKPSGALIIPVGSTVECEIYDWTSGIITLNSGTFTANDLADDGIYGTIRALGNAVVNLYQDAGSPVHLNGHLEALGSGTINVYGGNDWSNWGTVSDASVTMNGGTINFADQGILVQDNPPWQFTSNITGGTIKTSGSFRAWSPGFNPSGGTVELYGSGWVELSGNHGGYFNNLLIDKTTGSNVDISNINVHGGLTVVNGSLKLLSNKTLECLGSISLNSYLSVQRGAAIQLGNNSTFNANTDGMLHFSGSEEEKAKLTGITASDHYDIHFNSGSYLIAAQGIFENMGEQGVNFASGSEILLMTDCEFRNGKTGSNPMLTIDNNQDLVLENITFNGSSKASQFNVRKNVNEGSVFFLDSTGDMAGETFEDDTHGRIHWMPANHASDPQTIGNDVAICEDAFYMLTVADLVVESGGSADLIASQRIKILPGTHIMSGGNMHAWITETYEFCEQQESMLASVSPADEEEKSILPAMWFATGDDQYHQLKMYPNPTSGKVNIELNGLNPDEKTILQVYGITGELREQFYYSGAQTLSLDLSGLNPGVYLIRILDGNKSFTGKIIKQ